MLFELSKASQGESSASGNEVMNSMNLYKLEDTATEQLIQQQGGFMHPSASFKELCELLSIKKSPSVNVNAASKGKTHNQLVKLKLLTPPLTPTEIESANSANKSATMKPSRTSMRLFQKRNIKKEVKLGHFKSCLILHGFVTWGNPINFKILYYKGLFIGLYLSPT